MSTSTGTGKTRVAILGGGPAGLTAAMSLSATPELRARYDVTLYQSGWRVGGKCGQGRKGPANRIEINGTHYLFGAYNAVFEVARDVFAELEAAGDQRFGTYASQFLPCSTVAVKEFFNGNWDTWVINMPGDGVPPSSPAPDLTLGDTVRSVIGMIIDGCAPDRIAALVPTAGSTAETPAAPDAPHWWQRVADFTGRELHAAEHRMGLGLLHLALDLVRGLEREAMQPTVSEALVWLLSHFRSWAWDLLQKPSATHIDARRLWQLIDLGTSALIGIIQDRVFEPGGFDGIDQYDLREWLMRSGAQEATAWSAPIVTWYNAIAAYEHGDVTKPNMSAGIGLRGLLRLGLTYRGAFSFQLSYEVGDSLVAPLYQVLKNRGVRVMYFHRVRDVVPSADGASVESIVVERQVTLKSGDPASYEPFMTLPNGRPVWPDAPLADRIARPPACAADLLSFYAPEVGTTVTLTKGADFDTVVYALPVATARWYCAGLVNQKERVARDGRPSRHYRDAVAAHVDVSHRGTDRLDIRAKRALRLFRAARHVGGRAAADCRGNVACAAHAGRHRDAVRRPSGNACRLSRPRRRGVPCAARRAGRPDGDAVLPVVRRLALALGHRAAQPGGDGLAKACHPRRRTPRRAAARGAIHHCEHRPSRGLHANPEGHAAVPAARERDRIRESAHRR